MRRPPGILFNAATAASLLLFITVAALAHIGQDRNLWDPGVPHTAQLGWGLYRDGPCYVDRTPRPLPDLSPGKAWRGNSQTGYDIDLPWLRRTISQQSFHPDEFRTGPATVVVTRVLVLPAIPWLITTAILPLLWLRAAWRGPVQRRPRFYRWQCAACGYDCRATPAQCPECGLVRSRPSPN